MCHEFKPLMEDRQLLGQDKRTRLVFICFPTKLNTQTFLSNINSFLDFEGLHNENLFSILAIQYNTQCFFHLSYMP